jgi:hypothetical protein
VFGIVKYIHVLCNVKSIIYKITYPNGKIYVGKDHTNSINYWGSANDEYIAKDFTEQERLDMSIRRQIIWESETASISEVNQIEIELIKEYKSYLPEIGYNRNKIKKQNI